MNKIGEYSPDDEIKIPYQWLIDKKKEHSIKTFEIIQTN